MARTRSFDPDAALEVALEVFWSRGYADTSIADIVDATGVNRHSLYAVWKDKDGLYAAALERYSAHTASLMLEPLKRGGRAGIAANLRALAEMVRGLARNRGCFAVSTAVSGAASERVHALVTRHFANVEAAYQGALEVAVREGELPSDLDVVAHAAHLAIASQALLLQAKTGASAEALERYVAVTLLTLDAPLRRTETKR